MSERVPDPAPRIDRPHKFPLPSVTVSVGELHGLLADLGISGVTRIGEKTWVTFVDSPPLSRAKEIVRRVRGR